MTEFLSEAMESLCGAAEEYNASDLLLQEDKPPVLRISGSLTTLEFRALDAAFFEALWKACGATEDTQDYDSSLTSRAGVRFRVNLLRQLGKRAAVLRRIRHEIPTLESLGVPMEILRGWIARPTGLILISGATGSGKSTTLAASLQWMNENFCRHVVTIEDPIEYLFSNQKCLF
ncbi:MAG TPA: ATPase, T2SS/T4P/T4SS family, partial [Terrimicrobiaceae bacterium]